MSSPPLSAASPASVLLVHGCRAGTSTLLLPIKPMSAATPASLRLLLPLLQGREQALQAMSAFLWRFRMLCPGGTLDVGGMTPAAAQELVASAPHQVRNLSLPAQEAYLSLRLPQSWQPVPLKGETHPCLPAQEPCLSLQRATHATEASWLDRLPAS